MFVDAAGSRLYCSGVGEGVPVVVVHGGPGLDHTYLVPSLSQMDVPARLVFYDQRGNGRSAPLPQGRLPSLDDYAADTAAVADAFDFARFHLLGHSSGGLVALACARLFPRRVRSVILNGTAFAFDHLPRTLAPAGPRVAALARVTSAPRPTDAEFQRAFLEALPFYLADMSEERAIRLMAGVEFRASGFSAFRDGVLLRGDADRGLDAVAAPVLAILGADDRPYPPDILAAQVSARLPAARIVTIAGAGHFAFDEQPQAFACVLRGWFAEQG